MEGPRALEPIVRRAARPVGIAARLLLIGLVWGAAVRAEGNRYFEGFDGPQKSWVLEPHATSVTVTQRRQNRAHSGGAAEQFVFLAQQPDPAVVVSHEVPASLVFDELTASLWVRANRSGIRLGIQVRFPHHIDPRSGRPLQGVLIGESYTSVGEWQQLRCPTTQAAVQELLRRLRSVLQLQPGAAAIDARGLRAERVVLQLELQPGNTELYLDDLEFGPIVEPPAPREPAGRRREPLARRTRAVIGDDQILMDGRPVMILFTPYQGEEVDELARLRFNVAWIDRHDDAALLAALEAAGLWGMADPLPPDLAPEEAHGDVGLVAYSEETSPVLFWNMGTRVSPARLQTQALLMDKVRAADSRLGRPILLDVSGSEREFHRHADMIGASRHCLHTSTAPLDYLEFLRRKKKLALPDRPMFTLIQTEPADANLISRAEGQSLPVVEPEQLWMQGYAALAAGYKGIGAWKLTSLTAPIVGNDERRLALALLNAHVRLLEPWLASGKFMQMVPATIEPAAAPQTGNARGPLGRLERFVSGAQPHSSPPRSERTEIQVALFSCDQGLLLLPVWYENGAQFQPGPMFTGELSFVVSIGRENAQAWEVTTTGVVPLPSGTKRPAGGMPITLRDFDQFTAIVLTQGDAAVAALNQHVQQLRQGCARDWIDLAAAKTARVADVHRKLAPVAPTIPHADFMLAQARRLIDQAERDFQTADYDGARRNSRKAMQLTRTIQRRHWEKAVTDAHLTSGVCSPHTICFQTLPDHWAMLAAIGRRAESRENLLRSGSFEDRDTVFGDGWRHFQGADPRVRPRAELFGVGAAEGTYCLRLTADAVDPSHPPDEVAEPPEQFISPPIPVYAGQILHISGKLQIPAPLTGHPDGLVIYESIKGTVGALRFREATPNGQWQPFQLIREVHASKDLLITIELRGLGDVRIDELKVVAIDPE